MIKEISNLYYLENFNILIDFIEQHYKQILNKDVLAFIKSFQKMPENAQQLFVRILSRKKEGVRRSKLNYQEILNVSDALNILSENNLIIINDLNSITNLLNMFTKPELAVFCENSLEIKNLKKDDIVEHLLDAYDEAILLKKIFEFDSVIKVNVEYECSVIKLLFFGNSYQDLSEFVISKLGHIKYEQYELNFDHFLFQNMAEINGYLALNLISESVQECIELKDSQKINEISKTLIMSEFTKINNNKKYKVINKIAKYSEQNKNYEDAISMYELSQRHPSQERLARIYHRLNEIDKSKEICQKILKHSINQNEIDFAELFLNKLKGAKKSKFEVNKEELWLNKESGKSVEILVANELNVSPEREVYFVENKLFNALFGLWFWDIIFGTISGAFINPFQRGPMDMFSEDFILNRSSAITARLKELQSEEEFTLKCCEVHKQKNGIANYFIDWKIIDEALIKLACKYIPMKDIKIIFTRLLKSIKENKSGFPDLISFDNNSYQLIEVKGPGDKLQPNQTRWMKYFQEKNISAKVVHVKWNND
ncbi:MAG: hypothetical protein COA79_13005 [Planctomycetota bacterium]|nr:MAG: hypothetical protein COA79_13005 [Planctomycetota bacterium]